MASRCVVTSQLQTFQPTAKSTLHVFRGVSHAYMHVTAMLPEAKEVADQCVKHSLVGFKSNMMCAKACAVDLACAQASALSMQWLSQILSAQESGSESNTASRL